MKKSMIIVGLTLIACIVDPGWISAFIVALIYFFYIYRVEKEYKQGTYYKDTKIPYGKMRKDSGRYGEYLIYKNLKHREGDDGKFLFNVYIPKDSGKTTEIDVIFLCRKGIFVFESKNYSGWIFGDEKNKNWTQTLPQGRRSHKEHFYNPIRQNAGHIESLLQYVSEKARFYSVIAFSDRCTLKELNVQSQNVFVLHRREVEKPIMAVYEYCEDIMTQEELDALYETLYPFTQVEEEIKSTHVDYVDEIKQMPVSATRLSVDKGCAESVEKDKEKVAEEKKEEMVCPLCRGRLILRTARRGVRAGKSFYGCENYPKCTYIGNME